MEYTPSVDPLYWYQDGFYLAYYAKTYLGKTYSNHVPVSVANYHDLKEVMDDKLNHLHVDYDRSRLHRDSKIYINNYSGAKDGLDLFKDFYDLSVLTSPTTNPETGLITGGTFEGHKPLNTDATNGVKAGQNLQFILRTDIKHTGKSWTSIGTDAGTCFEGNFHGDGHTISGLNNSLFNHLCGNVYNLGVMGTFTGAGIAETGDGYVENCWVSTSSTAAKTSKPVFGNPSKAGDFKQIVNSYYMEEDDAENKYKYTNHSGTYGIPTRKDAQAFYNGEVAYDLNGFYLYKRYNDGVGTASGVDYNYFTLDESGNIPTPKTPVTGHYTDNMPEALCSSGYNGIKYVEDRFADGDFRYAAGEIPGSEDERHWIDTEDENKSYFFPIWPDDYIFFGQKLTYGWAAQAHQNVPTAVAREDGRLSTGDDANRVYRAPAYYRSMVMGMTHFNPHAYLAQKEKLTDEQIEANEKAVEESRPEDVVTPRDAYPNMTAIDFKGHDDLSYQLGLNGKWFYTPLLDDDGLLSIQNCDETQNIVVYAPAEDANDKTYRVLNSYFTEPTYSEDNTDGYRLVAEASAASVHGHLVQNDKTSTNDHLLVDYQDFNAPIAYTLGAEKRMWYQRLPLDKEYVNLTKGWQGISIPFTAELVTTDQKGEITHFYSGSNSIEGSEAKIGHEYWLREFNNIEEKEVDKTTVAYATFDYPTAADVNKNVTNTFLWDYYYENTAVHNQKDKNADEYQEYYSNSRTYNSYPLLTKATPYILGLPGSTYYEFDLSGKFEAKNTAVSIPKLGKQIISFVSQPGISIGVSDNEMTGKMSTYGDNDYIFKPSYMNESLAVDEGNYALNANGDSYDKVTGSAKSVGAFRPYFTSQIHPTSSRKYMPERIVFGGDHHGLEEEPQSTLDGSLSIYVKNHKIITTSHLKEPVTICIRNVSGIAIANYVLQPGETQETRVKYTGVYIVNKKKIIVK